MRRPAPPAPPASPRRGLRACCRGSARRAACAGAEAAPSRRDRFDAFVAAAAGRTAGAARSNPTTAKGLAAHGAPPPRFTCCGVPTVAPNGAAAGPDGRLERLMRGGDARRLLRGACAASTTAQQQVARAARRAAASVVAWAASQLPRSTATPPVGCCTLQPQLLAAITTRKHSVPRPSPHRCCHRRMRPAKAPGEASRAIRSHE